MTQREPGWNRHEPILEVSHFELNPIDERPNRWISECPACKEGVLTVMRDNDTLLIQQYDVCKLCGQRIEYTDVEKMRARDWA